MAGELITKDGQLQFKNYLLGDDEITFMDAINGWDDLPGIDSANAIKPASHGAWPGKKLATQRIITWEGRFAALPGSWSTEIKRLKDSFSVPIDSSEDSIVIRTHDEIGMAFGAVTGRAIPGDRSYGYYGASLNLQFTCSDPRIYSLGEKTWTLSLPLVEEDGLEYPLNYPLDYGVEVSSSSGTLFNAGNVVTPAVFQFTGPMRNPTLLNSTAGTRLGFNINLVTGETLTVNTRNGTVLLNGADRLYARTLISSPILSFGLLPGNNNMQLLAAEWDIPAGVVITWRDAKL